MRWNICRHPNGDTGSTIHQQVREAGGEDPGLLPALVVVGIPVHRVLLDVVQQVEGELGSITTDYYLNRKGGVAAVQGDTTLGDIGDVVHLLDTFYAGSPAPKGLFGYTEGMARDILEDLKRTYYDEVDGLQDSMAACYAVAFRIHLLFKGIDPGVDEFTLRDRKSTRLNSSH